MTITSEVGRAAYAGDGASTQFTVPFKFFQSSDLRVILQSANGVDSELTENVDYTVSGAGDEGGGTVTLATAPASGQTLTIILDPPRTQLTDYVSNDAFPAESHERALDRLTQQNIRALDIVSRALRLPDGDPNTLATLPGAAARANKFLRFDNNGDPEMAVGIDQSQTLSRSVIGQFLYPQTPEEVAAGVTPVNYAYPPLNVRRYGAALDGVTNDTAAFEAAAKVAHVMGGGEVVFDGPTVVRNITWRDKVSLRGIGNPTMTLDPAVATDVAIRAVGSVETGVALASNATSGSLSVAVADASGFSVGDWVLISEDTWIVPSTDGQRREINRIRAISGTTIYLQSRLIDSYTTSASAEIAKLNPVSGCKFRDFDIVVPVGTNGGGVAATYMVDFTFTGMTISGFAAVPGIRMTMCAFGRVTGNTFRGGQGSAVGGSSGLPFDVIQGSHHISCDHNILEDYNQVQFSMRTRHCRFAHNICRRAVDSAVNTHGDGNSDIVIEGNDIDGSEAIGIAVGFTANHTGDRRVTVRDNMIRNCGSFGITASSSAGKEHQEITIEGNVISAVKLTSSVTADLIQGVYCTDIIVRNNRLDGTTVGNDPDHGISLVNCTRAKVHGNKVRSLANGNGIQMTNCADYDIDGNEVSDIAVNNFYTSGSSGSAYIRNNYCDDNAVSIEPTVISYGNPWDVGVFTGTLTGVTGTVTDDIGYVRIGRHVTLNIRNGNSGTSNSTAAGITGLPQHLWPAREQRINGVSVMDSGNVVAGRMVISTNGSITLYTSLDGAPFTASGQKGFQKGVYVYSLA